jgi:hypothetical protein
MPARRLAALPLNTGVRIARGLDQFVSGIAQSADRVSALLDEVELLIGRAGVAVTRAETVLDEVEGTAAGAAEALGDVRPLVTGAADVLGGVRPVVVGAAEVLDDVRPVVAGAAEALVEIGTAAGRANQLTDDAAGISGRASAVVDDLDGIVRQLVDADLAAVSGLAALLDDLRTLLAGIRAMDRVIVDDATTVVRALPTVLDRLDSEVLPALTALEGLVPVVAQLGVRVENLNDVVADVGTLISGIPGTGRLLRRAEKDGRAAKQAVT